MNLNKRNYPPEHGIYIPCQVMEDFITALFAAVGMSCQDAGLMATLLTANDRRCLFSHGSKQIPYYLKKIMDGEVNPRPHLSVHNESPAALVMDGDGGLGYFPCYYGTQAIIKKAKDVGIAALTTRNHQHFGAASNYTRMALAQHCIGLATSSYRTTPHTDGMIYDTVDTSPVSIAIPAGAQPPLVMDMGGQLICFEEELFKRLPTPFFKAMALNSALRALGGIFPGIFKPEIQSASPWEANQGAFIVVVDITHFISLEELQRDMDHFIGAARQSKPLPGMEAAELAGGNEWHWDRENATKGIPISDEHRQLLLQEAAALGVDTPFAQYDDTCF